jgi:hypothetical protein
MSKGVEEIFFAPRCVTHFSCDRHVGGMFGQDVLGHSSYEGDVGCAVILARSRGVLVEYDIQWPVQVVFDAPMRSRDLQGSAGGVISREGDVARALFRLASRRRAPPGTAASLRPTR